MIDERSNLLESYYSHHRTILNEKIVMVSLIFLALSTSWNVAFQLFHLKLSRANIPILLISACITGVIYLFIKRFPRLTLTNQQLVLILVLFIIFSLYFGSGYHESWGFFLCMPLIAGLYGEKRVLFAYSFVGLIGMLIASVSFPQSGLVYDTIDISNRVLLFIIIIAFSHLLHAQLRKLYMNQVNFVQESMESTIEQVVNGFIISIEAKDSYTFGHSERVSQYAVELASRLPGYQGTGKLKALQLTALLHDVGKINIPESVLRKPDKLTEEEYRLIQTHTIVGARMVEKISGLGPLKPGVLYHHEKWDGSGYPTGARGTDIPLDARILGVADAFDAMTSNRAYRSALSFHEAYERLIQGSGTHFDPMLIERLPEVKLSWLKIYKDSNNELDEFERLTDLFF